MPDAIPPINAPAPVRVLVADDSSAVVTGIRRFLAARRGVAVVAAAVDGHDAIEKCRQHQPDIVVMDVHMPALDGLKAAASLRREFPAIRIILISVDQGEQLRADSLKHGADAFLPKIGLQHNLMNEIRRLFPHVPGSTPPFGP